MHQYATDYLNNNVYEKYICHKTSCENLLWHAENGDSCKMISNDTCMFDFGNIDIYLTITLGNVNSLSSGTFEK